MFNITERPIIVIGDVMLDTWITGTATKISPEAPVPVVSLPVHEEPSHSLGGAANVAANIASLGGKPILIGTTGWDTESVVFYGLTRKAGINVDYMRQTPNPTTHKTRITAGGQQIVRLDREVCEPMECSKGLKRDLATLCEYGAAAIVVSDYEKGVVSFTLTGFLFKLAETWDIPIFLDPKVGFGVGKYTRSSNCKYTVTPNLAEAKGLVGTKAATDADYARAVGRLLGANVLLKRGDKGVILYRGSDCVEIPAMKPQAVFDVSGAGDTVLAAMVLATVSGLSPFDAAFVANVAGGLVVGKHGTATLTWDELQTAVEAAASTYPAFMLYAC